MIIGVKSKIEPITHVIFLPLIQDCLEFGLNERNMVSISNNIITKPQRLIIAKFSPIISDIFVRYKTEITKDMTIWEILQTDFLDKISNPFLFYYLFLMVIKPFEKELVLKILWILKEHIFLSII